MGKPRAAGGVGAVVSARGFAVAGAKVGRVCLALFALVLLVLIRGSLTWITFALTISVAGCALLAILGPRRHVLLGLGYVAGFAVFSLLRGLTDQTPVPVQYDYVLALERALPGPMPTLWLQEHLRDANAVNPLDYVLVAVHLSYFVVPILVGAALWRSRRDAVVWYTVTLLVVFYVGLVCSFLLPTAPPWLAGDTGHGPPVVKVSDWVYRLVNADGPTRDIVRMNAVAAMPSLHMAITVVVALGLRLLGRRWAVIGYAYAALMAFALVYLAEHYVVDEVAGAVLALASWTAMSRLAAPKARRFMSFEA